MKKSILLLLPAIFAFSSAESAPDKGEQSTEATQSGDTGGKCYDENTHIINLGAGFGGARSYYRAGRGYTTTPTFSISYEQPIRPRVGPGYIGVGAFMGFQHSDYRYDDRYSNYYYEHDWNSLSIMARGAYHWDVLNSSRAEVYAGVLIGVRMQFYDYHSNYPDTYDTYQLHENVAYPAYGVYAGARWYFVKNVALFAEAGVGNSYLTGGFSFKF